MKSKLTFNSPSVLNFYEMQQEVDALLGYSTSDCGAHFFPTISFVEWHYDDSF